MIILLYNDFVPINCIFFSYYFIVQKRS